MLHIGHQREELDIELERKKLTQGNSFVRGSVRRRDDGERGASKSIGRSERVESSLGAMADRRISKRLKGKVVSTCVTRACLYGTETLAMTDLQQQRLQVCENNWVRKIARVTRASTYKRRMVALRQETGVQRSMTERLVRTRLQWAGHVERWGMADYRRERQSYESRAAGDE